MAKSLFTAIETAQRRAAEPLAARMRPREWSEFAGQQHLLAPGRLLRRLIDSDCLSSVIFYGPPGTGKTSLAELIARKTRRRFIAFNAASAGSKELRELLDAARGRLETAGERTILFVDELHHFNKTQQSVLLPDLESGTVAMVAATTANPFFALIPPLVSRSHLFELKALECNDLAPVLERALADRERGFGQQNLRATRDAVEFLARACEGDVRKALGALEVAVLSLPAGVDVVDLDLVRESIQKKIVRYDGRGDEHYDCASAYIKSLRGTDPDAAIYWLARMLEAGEDPRFIARRLMIAAAEDVGNADPQALVIASAAATAVEWIGMPECRIPLAQATTYVALAPKSNASYAAINAAIDDVRMNRVQPVPAFLRDPHSASGRGAVREAGRGTYVSPHAQAAGDVQQYLSTGETYYHPGRSGFEAELARRLDEARLQRESASPG